MESDLGQVLWDVELRARVLVLVLAFLGEPEVPWPIPAVPPERLNNSCAAIADASRRPTSFHLRVLKLFRVCNAASTPLARGGNATYSVIVDSRQRLL